jgi:hypothetical protein
MAVIILGLLALQIDTVEGAFEAFGGATMPTIVPHKASDLAPIVVDDDLFVE